MSFNSTLFDQSEKKIGIANSNNDEKKEKIDENKNTNNANSQSLSNEETKKRFAFVNSTTEFRNAKYIGMLKNEIVLYEKMRTALDNLLKQRKLTKDPKVAEKLLHRSTNGDNFQNNSNFEPYNTLQRIEDEREKLREKKELIVKLRENKLYKASKSAEMVISNSPVDEKGQVSDIVENQNNNNNDDDTSDESSSSSVSVSSYMNSNDYYNNRQYQQQQQQQSGHDCERDYKEFINDSGIIAQNSNSAVSTTTTSTTTVENSTSTSNASIITASEAIRGIITSETGRLSTISNSTTIAGQVSKKPKNALTTTITTTSTVEQKPKTVLRLKTNTVPSSIATSTTTTITPSNPTTATITKPITTNVRKTTNQTPIIQTTAKTTNTTITSKKPVVFSSTAIKSNIPPPLFSQQISPTSTSLTMRKTSSLLNYLKKMNQPNNNSTKQILQKFKQTTTSMIKKTLFKSIQHNKQKIDQKTDVFSWFMQKQHQRQQQTNNLSSSVIAKVLRNNDETKKINLKTFVVVKSNDNSEQSTSSTSSSPASSTSSSSTSSSSTFSSSTSSSSSSSTSSTTSHDSDDSNSSSSESESTESDVSSDDDENNDGSEDESVEVNDDDSDVVVETIVSKKPVDIKEKTQQYINYLQNFNTKNISKLQILDNEFCLVLQLTDLETIFKSLQKILSDLGEKEVAKKEKKTVEIGYAINYLHYLISQRKTVK